MLDHTGLGVALLVLGLILALATVLVVCMREAALQAPAPAALVSTVQDASPTHPSPPQLEERTQDSGGAGDG